MLSKRVKEWLGWAFWLVLLLSLAPMSVSYLLGLFGVETPWTAGVTVVAAVGGFLGAVGICLVLGVNWTVKYVRAFMAGTG